MSDVGGDLALALAALWRDAYGTALARIGLIDDYLGRTLALGPHDEALAAARGAAHKLAGTLGTFGLPEGSVVARELEHIFDLGHPLRSTLVDLAERAVTLRRIVTSAAPAPSPVAPVTTNPSVDDRGTDSRAGAAERTTDLPSAAEVTVFGLERSLVEALLFDLRRLGLTVEVHRTVVAPDISAARVVAVDARLYGSAQIVARASAQGALVVVFGVPDDWDERHRFVGSGASWVIGEQAPPAEIAALVVRVAVPDGRRPNVALVNAAGETCDARLIDGLRSAGADLAEGCDLARLAAAPNGIELLVVEVGATVGRAAMIVRTIRCDHRWDLVGVVCLVDDSAGSVCERLMSAGAGDVFSVDAEVTPSVVRLLDRVRSQRRHHFADGADPAFSPARISPDSTPETEAEAERVLVIDDDETIQMMMEQVLTRHGYQVQIVADGLEASRLLGDADFMSDIAFVLLDVGLPGMDGFSVLRRMHVQGTIGIAPIVMMTARSRDDEVLAAWELGVTDHIAKPFSIPVLLHRIEALRSRAGQR